LAPQNFFNGCLESHLHKGGFQAKGILTRGAPLRFFFDKIKGPRITANIGLGGVIVTGAPVVHISTCLAPEVIKMNLKKPRAEYIGFNRVKFGPYRYEPKPTKVADVQVGPGSAFFSFFSASVLQK